MASNSKNLAELLNSDVTLTATDIANGAVTTDKLAADAVTTAKIADTVNLGRRNLIINGAMQVAQRGTSATVTTGSGPQTCDRFFVEATSSGTFSITQSTTAPNGFSNSLKFDCTVADASPNFLLFGYRIEGQDVQNLKKGTSDALSTTVSFYVRSSKTGTYQVNLRDIDNSRIIGTTYTISSANTWEYKTVTFAGDTSGAMGNDNGNSLTVEWWLAAGSTYNSGAVPTAWEATDNGDRAAGLNVAIGASTDDEFLITGIQLEVGDTATPFEHRLYGEELSLCQRYYFSGDLQMVGNSDSGGTPHFSVQTPQMMRTQPTLISSSVQFRGALLDTGTGISLTSTVPPRLSFTATNSGSNNTVLTGFGGSMSVQIDSEL